MRAIDSILRFVLFGLILGALAPSVAQSAEPCAYIEGDMLVECERVAVRKFSIAPLRQVLEERGLPIPTADELRALMTGGDPIEYSNGNRLESFLPVQPLNFGMRIIWSGKTFKLEEYSRQKDVPELGKWAFFIFPLLLAGAAFLAAVGSGIKVSDRSPFLLRPSSASILVSVAGAVYFAESGWWLPILSIALGCGVGIVVGIVNERYLDREFGFFSNDSGGVYGFVGGFLSGFGIIISTKFGTELAFHQMLIFLTTLIVVEFAVAVVKRRGRIVVAR